MRRGTTLLAGLLLVLGGVLLLRLVLGPEEDPAEDPTRAAVQAPAAPASKDEVPRPSAEVVAAGAPEASGVRRAVPESALEAAAAAPAPARVGAGHLRVVEADGRTPCAGFLLTALLLGPSNDRIPEEQPRAERPLLAHVTLTTDANGYVNLSAELEQRQSTELVRFFSATDFHFAIEPGELSAAELSASSADPTVLRTLARTLSPIAALAVDDETGAPLPELALRVQRWIELPMAESDPEEFHANGFVVPSQNFEPREAEWVVTDATGRFVTERSYPSGRIGFLTIDQERADLQHVATLDETPVEVVLEVPVGPVIRLAFTPGGSRRENDYAAGIWRAPEELLCGDGVQEHPSPWSRDGGNLAGLWGNAVPVHAGELAWLRLPVDQEEEPLPSFLFLLSRDGASFGFAPIDSFERHRESPLRVPLTELLVLDGFVVWPEVPESIGSIEIALVERTESEAEPCSRWVPRMNQESKSAFQFQALAAGAYILRVEEGAVEALELEVQVPSAEPIELTLRPRTVETVPDVVGRIVTASGMPLDGRDGRAHLGRVNMWLTGPGSRQSYHDRITWEGGLGTFRLRDVAAGTYQLLLSWNTGGFPIDPGRVTVEIPGPLPEFRVRDGGPSERLEVRILDPPASGELQVQARLGGSGWSGAYFSFEESDLLEILADGRQARVFEAGPFGAEAKLTLELSANGYRTASLSEDAIPPADGNGRRSVEITPEKGWSARISVYAVDREDDSDRRPLPAVVLTLDGVAQSATDAEGDVQVEAERKPETIGVATPGWRLVTRTSWNDWGSVFADTGAFTVESGLLDVFLFAEER